MNLLQQFQGIIGSLILGGLFCFIYLCLKSLLNHKYLIVLWMILQPLYFLLVMSLYHIFLCEFTFGIYNIFFTLSLVVGVCLYLYFYHSKIKILLLKVEKKIDLKIKFIDSSIKKWMKSLDNYLKSKRKKNKTSLDNK